MLANEPFDSRIGRDEVCRMFGERTPADDDYHTCSEVGDDWAVVALDLPVMRDTNPTLLCDMPQPYRVVRTLIEMIIVEFNIEPLVRRKSGKKVNSEIYVDEKRVGFRPPSSHIRSLR